MADDRHNSDSNYESDHDDNDDDEEEDEDEDEDIQRAPPVHRPRFNRQSTISEILQELDRLSPLPCFFSPITFLLAVSDDDQARRQRMTRFLTRYVIAYDG
jgi:hypothetical protein